MTITNRDVRRTLPSLYLVFLGGLIWGLDFTVNQFDLINDVVGVIMITWGVVRLGKLQVHAHYSKAMLFIKLVAVLECVSTFCRQVFDQLPQSLSNILPLFSVVLAIAVVVFCVAMYWLSAVAHLNASIKSWKITALLFVAIYLIPIIITHITGAIIPIVVGDASFEAYRFDGIWAALLVLSILLVLLIPVAYFLRSILTMKHETKMSFGS